MQREKRKRERKRETEREGGGGTRQLVARGCVECEWLVSTDLSEVNTGIHRHSSTRGKREGERRRNVSSVFLLQLIYPEDYPSVSPPIYEIK